MSHTPSFSDMHRKPFIYFSVRSIWLYAQFKLGNSTIIYICDTQHLNIIPTISYLDIFNFFIVINITPYKLLFYSAYTVPLDPSRCLFVGIINIIIILNAGITTPIHGFFLILSQTLTTLQANIPSSWSTYTHVSALYLYLYYYGLVYHIDILFRTIQCDCFYSPTLCWQVCVISFSFYSI